MHNLPETKLRPPLKWAGGKRWLVPILQPIWEKHSHRRLVEPLCGGLAVTLGLMPERALLNDINEHLIHFYLWLKEGLEIEIEVKNNETFYYECRKRFNILIKNGQAASKEAVSLFYYLNHTGYNGLCRFNRSGEFNVPFGRYKTINYEKNFLPYKSAFANWEFLSANFDKIEFHPADFIYADPPYDVEFTQYSKEGFSWDNQVQLAELLSRHKGPVVLSNQATPRIIELYKKMGFSVKFYQAPRKINCTGDRTPAREILATRGV